MFRQLSYPFKVFFFGIVLGFAVSCTHTESIRFARAPEEVESRRPEDAVEFYENVLMRSKDPEKLAKAHYQLGMLDLEEDRDNSTREHFEEAIRLDRDSVWGTGAAAELIVIDTSLSEEERYKRLTELSKKATAQAVRDRIEYHLAELDFRFARWASALKRLRQAVMLRQSDGYQYWYRIGTCELRLKDYAQAEQDLKKALGLNTRHHPGVHLALSELYLKTGRIPEALESLFSLVETYPLPAIEIRINSLLRDHVSDELLNRLAAVYSAGHAGYLVAAERVRRLEQEGELDRVSILLENMKRTFPEYINRIDDEIRHLAVRRNVRCDRVGLLAPVSGPLSGIGYSVYRGAELAVKAFRLRDPPVDVELVVKDTAGKTDKALAGFKALAEEDRVIAVLGPIRSDTVRAIAPEASAERCPVITPGCPREGILSMSPYVYRIYPSAREEAYILTRFLITHLGLTKFACVYPDEAYGKNALAGLKQSLHTFGGTLVYSVSYQRDTSTFHHLLKDMKDMDIDVIVLPDQADRAAIVAGQIRYQEMLEPVIVGTGGWDDPNLIRIAGSHLEGSFFITGYPLSSQRRREIRQIYLTQYGEKPDVFALRSFEAMYIILQGLSEGYKYRGRLQHALQTPGKLAALDGAARFSPEGNLQPPLTIYIIRKGLVVPYMEWREDSFYPIVEDNLPLPPLFPQDIDIPADGETGMSPQWLSSDAGTFPDSREPFSSFSVPSSPTSSRDP